MKAYRSSILRFASDREPRHAAIFEEDGLLVVAPDAAGVQVVKAVGSYQSLIGQFPDLAVEHLPGRVIAPGFVDMHLHYPQTDIIGSPAPGLLPWLENYTFPEEKRFS
ncbi:MAG: guanine deaminase, partial [Burkholderiaceae bacterium]|nr:guanine deaminase [Burkholderiaceae bacterium]